MGGNSETGGDERRQHQRVDQKIRIDFKVDSNKKTIQGETYNISPVGVYCRVNRPIAEMTQLMIMLDLPGGQIECEGTVVRSELGSQDDHRLAIFFHKISDESTRQLAQFISG